MGPSAAASGGLGAGGVGSTGSGAAAGAATRVSPASASNASRSAATSSPALAKRAAGSFASARSNTASSPRGRAVFASRSPGTGSRACAAASAVGLSRANGRSPRQELVRDDSERVAVARGRSALPARLLRREVARGAEHRARTGERVEPRRARDPEVGDVDVPLPSSRRFAGLTSRWTIPAAVRRVERRPASSSQPSARAGGCAPSRRSTSSSEPPRGTP